MSELSDAAEHPSRFVSLFRSSLSRAAGASLVITVVGVGLSAASQLLVARVTTLKDYGAFAYAITWAALFALVGRCGFDKSALRFLPRYEATGDLASAAAFRRFSVRSGVVASAAAVLVGCVAILLLGGHMEPIRRNALLASLLIAPALALIQVEESHVRAARRPALSVAPESIALPLTLAALVLAAHATGVDLTGPRAVVLAAGAYALVLLGFHLVVVPRVVQRAAPAAVDSATRRLWIAASAQLAAGGAAALMLTQGDIVVLGALAPAEDVARYAVAAKVALTVSLLPNAVGLILAPTLAQLLATGQRSAAQRLLTRSTRATLAAVVLAACVVALGGDAVLGLFGSEYRDAYGVLVILLAGQVLFAAAGPGEVALTVSDRPATLTRIFAVSGTCNVALCVVLVPLLGPIGAAIAAGSARVAQTHVARIMVRRHMGLNTGPFRAAAQVLAE